MLKLQLPAALLEPLKTLTVIVKEQAPEQGAPSGGSEKRMVPLFGYIDADDQVIGACADLSLELTELGVPGNLIMLHDNLLLADI